DADALELARDFAKSSDVGDRVAFYAQDGGDPSLSETYDLVTFFECLHDLSRPVEALRNARRLLAPGGSVVVMDERVAETFAPPVDDVDRFMYAASVLICLPGSMAEQPSAATGTVMRPDTLRSYSSEAGFEQVEILPIEHDFFRFYRLR